jgi:hypothetical protein
MIISNFSHIVLMCSFYSYQVKGNMKQIERRNVMDMHEENSRKGI